MVNTVPQTLSLLFLAASLAFNCAMLLFNGAWRPWMLWMLACAVSVVGWCWSIDCITQYWCCCASLVSVLLCVVLALDDYWQCQTERMWRP